jgi:1-phosphofructokinase family hexose kinase
LILTVTLNPAIDVTIGVDRLAFEDRSYIHSRVTSAGGRGINASRVLHAFGAETLALAPSGGKSGAEFEAELAKCAFPFEAVQIGKCIRTNLIVTDSQGLTVKLNERGSDLTDAELERFESAVEKHLPRSKWMLISGSLPPGVNVSYFGRLMERARAHGAQVFVDTDGEHLQAVLEQAPNVVAPNQQEAERLLNRSLITRGQFIEAVQRIQAMGAEIALLSLGGRGAVTTDGRSTFEIIPPRVDAVAPIGAGDALDAAFLWARLNGSDFADAARWGVAAGTASAVLPGMAFPALEQVRAIYQRVEINRLP